MPEKKKSNPNGILEWIVDFFVTPIANAAATVLKPVIDAIDKDEILKEGSSVIDTFIRAIPSSSEIFKTKSTITPDDAVKQAWEYDGRVETAYLTGANVATAVEAISLGQIDITMQNYLHSPQQNAALSNAEMFRRAEFMEGVYPAIQRRYRRDFTPIIPEAYRLALAGAKGIIPLDLYIDAMAENGIDSHWSLVYQEQNYEYPTFTMLAELYWRKVIDDETFTRWMQRTGAPLDVISAMKSLRELIPPAGDLVTMVVREAFVPEMVTPAPAVFAENMTKKGYSREWANRYWTMHWLPMPLTQAYDNLARGYWSKEDFLNLLKISDIHPRWREDIYRVAFLPPSLRELGYGFDTGIYTLDDIVKYRRYARLSPEDAEKSATAMVAYRTEAEREALRREHVHLYAMGRETKVALEENLRRLWTNPYAIPLWIERAELEELRLSKEPAFLEPRDVTSSEALFAFEHYLRDETWTRAELKSLAWTDDRIDLAIERKKREMVEAELKEEKTAAKELSVTQLRNLYKHNRISREELVFGLSFLKYSWGDAELLAQQIVDTVAAELAPRDLSLTDVKRLYDYSLLGVPISDIRKVVDDVVRAEGVNSPTKELLGYYESFNYSLDDSYRLTLWTIIDMELPNLRSLYSKGWINSTQLFNGIMEMGIPKDRAEIIAMTVVKAEQPARVASERDLTKSEIIKGVKADILTPSQAVELLQSIGYDEDEAWYLLYINAVVERSDPQTYWEMRKVTEQYKKARGEPSIDIPDELITLDLQLKEAKAKLEKLKAEKASEEEIGKVSVEVGTIQSEMRTMIAKLGIK